MEVLASIKKIQYEESIKYYFYPQFEILEDNKLRKIGDKRQEFPNKGTSLIVVREGDSNRALINKAKIIEQYKNSLLPIHIDTSQVSLSYREEEENSCKYSIVLNSITGLSPDELVEVIKVEDSIEEIIENDNRRNIHISKMPLNKKILLEIGDYIYGHFEYSIKATNTIEDTEEIQEIDYVLRINATTLNRNTIKKYKKDEIKNNSHIIYIDNDGKSREFIYNTKCLEKIEEEETIDFIEDKSLVNLLKKVVEDNKKIKLTNEQVRRIKECLVECENIEFKESRIKRLDRKILITDEYLDFKQALITDYFNTEAGLEDKKNYLEANLDKLEMVLNRVKGIEKVREKLDKEIEEIQDEVNKHNLILEEKKSELEQIQKQKNDFINKEMELKKKQFTSLEAKTKALEIQKQELETKIEEYSITKKKIDLNIELKEDTRYLERYKEQLSTEIGALQDKLNVATANRKNDLAEYLNDKMRREIFERILEEKTAITIEKEQNMQISLIEHRKDYDTAEEIIDIVQDIIVNKGKREFSREDIINILISISQNFITVFAGEPGVGKTSLCELLTKSLGLYDNRFSKVSVERGWTSSKDLIGYYNPLTKIIEKTNLEMYKCLATLDLEVENNINEMFFVLLDEANLSPIEHYWSSFMMLTDKFGRVAIQLGGNIEYRLSEGIRFLATINYDHTTENLSNRFLDRAWVILIDVPQQDSLLATEEFESNIEENIDAITLDSLSKFFTVRSGDEENSLNPSIETVWLNIIEVLYQGRIYISARSRIAILNYCIVAQKYMDIENNRYMPLDYAVAQKILPMINGYGDDYRETLIKLLEIFKNNTMNKCRDILNKVIEVGDKEHGYYQYFCR